MSKSEKFRKQFAEELRISLKQNDQQINHMIEIEQQNKLKSVQYDIAEEQLKLLYDSISQLALSKNLEDKFQLQIQNLEDEKRELSQDKQMLHMNFTEM